jgi:hypothetical protein
MKAIHNPKQVQVGGRSNREISILDEGQPLGVSLSLNLKLKAFDELLGILLESQSNRELASIFEAPSGEFADSLISILQAAVTPQRSGTIIYSEALSADVRNFGWESGE